MAAKKKAAKTKAKAKTQTSAKTATVKKKTTTKKAVVKKQPASTPAAATKKAAAKKTATKKVPAKPAATASKKATAGKKSPGTASAKPTRARKPAATAAGPVMGVIEPYAEKRGEEYMNEDQIQHFRNILQTWKRELMEEVDRTVHHMQDEAANFPDPNDRATQESEFSMELRARDRERKLIKKIDESLANLDNEDYGYCEACGVEIGIRRLEARPTATQCIDCKTLDEIREKQRG